MRNISKQFTVLAVTILVAASQVNAANIEKTSSVSDSASIVTKISNCLHKMPVISSVLNRRCKFDYVAEDELLMKYMLGENSTVTAYYVNETEEEIAMEEFTEEDTAISNDKTEDVLAYDIYTPISFAADYEE